MTTAHHLKQGGPLTYMDWQVLCLHCGSDLLKHGIMLGIDPNVKIYLGREGYQHPISILSERLHLPFLAEQARKKIDLLKRHGAIE